MEVTLKQLSFEDGLDVYAMLQELPAEENGFVNPMKGKTFQEFKQWLLRSDNASKDANRRPVQTIFWLYADGVPVGMAKLRQFITEEFLTAIGNVGYAIRPGYRNMGYGKLLLGLLVQRAKALSIDRLVLTINADNPSSVAVALANGGKVDRSSDGRLIVSIHI